MSASVSRRQVFLVHPPILFSWAFNVSGCLVILGGVFLVCSKSTSISSSWFRSPMKTVLYLVRPGLVRQVQFKLFKRILGVGVVNAGENKKREFRNDVAFCIVDLAKAFDIIPRQLAFTVEMDGTNSSGSMGSYGVSRGFVKY